MSTFPDAGSDEDLRAAYIQARVDERRAQADVLMAKARALLAGPFGPAARPAAERAARAALTSYARSMDWAEDGPAEPAAHALLDDAGRWVRRTFGCSLHQEGTSYSQTCPVALAHNRIGFSVGGIATRVCGLCGEDLSECSHERGTSYLVPGGAEDLGWCRVCGSEGGCEHSPAELYRTSVVARITQMDLEEVSLVSKPAQPEASLASVSISHVDLRGLLGGAFLPGVRVSCDRCLRPCAGLTRNDVPHG